MRHKYLLIGILIVSALLRIVNLGGGDVLGDEALYAFRAVGMMDYDQAEFQTTPWEWHDPDIPFWAKLSFHDHPPMVFLAQHVFMAVFGENNFGFRLPSALLGVAAVYLLYLIGARLLHNNAGLLAAALFGFTANHVFISRVGLQEAYVIFFILLAIHFFLRALEERKYFLWTGAAIGLGLLTKYTALIVVPIFLTYLLWRRRELLKSKYLWLGSLIAFVLFMPVVIYNIGLYASAGHFDFQISYVLGQDPEIWQSAPGKEEIGTLADRVRAFIPNLVRSNSWFFLALFGISIPLLRKRPFLLIALGWLALMLFFIGPTVRFLTVLTPFIALSVSAFFSALYYSIAATKKRFTILVMGAILLFEFLYSVNSKLFHYPLGPSPWTYAEAARGENINWGYNELDAFLRRVVKGKVPGASFILQYEFLNKAQEKGILRGQQRGFIPVPVLIVYDDNLLNIPQLWILDRLQIYHGWPVLKASEYQELSAQLEALTERYFIFPTENVPLDDARGIPLNPAGTQLENTLQAAGLAPHILHNKRGEPVFRTYSKQSLDE